MKDWQLLTLILYAWASGVFVGWRMHLALRGESPRRRLTTKGEG